MVDVVDTETRSRMMSGIRGKDTKPEWIIRRGLHSRGYRYRLHDQSLPGKPDLVLPKYRAVVFVHGCFWHGHGCQLFKWPKTRETFWRNKIERNMERDTKSICDLERQGWRIATIWECGLRSKGGDVAADALEDWLSSGNAKMEFEG